jgi:hypothetical protein
MIRWLVTTAWCAFLTLGCALILSPDILRLWQPAPSAFRAATALKAGQVLRQGDLEPAPATGVYLQADVDKGQIVQLNSLLPLPILQFHADRIVAAVSVPRGMVDSGDIKPGANIYLCQAPPNPVPGPYAVQSAICADGGIACIALLELPADKAAPLAAVLAKAPILVKSSACLTP